MVNRWLLSGLCAVVTLLYLFCSVGWLHVEWRGWGAQYADRCSGEEREERVDLVVDTLRYERIDPITVVLDTLSYSYMGDESAISRSDTATSRDDYPLLCGDSLPKSSSKSSICDSIYTFEDIESGRWSAEISGRNVELRSLSIHDRVEYRRVTSFVEPRWDVALKVGVTQDLQWAGVGVTRNIGRLALTLDCGYEMRSKEPIVGASASFSLWRE